MIEQKHPSSSAREAAVITRWVAVALLPFLVLAWIILYLFPAHTADWFAWPIQPAMTAMLMGAGYLSGAYFFTRVATVRAWRPVAAGFLPVALFAALMALTTLLHWPRFSHDHLAFIAWAGLYFITPLLVFVLWLLNHRLNRAGQASSGRVVPRIVRFWLGGIGLLLMVAGLYFYVNPVEMIAIWPWEITPLTARSLLGFFILPAASELALAFKSQWNAYRIVLEGQILALALILLGVLRAWTDFDLANPGTYLFVGGLLFFLLTNLGLYFGMRRAVRPENRLLDQP